MTNSKPRKHIEGHVGDHSSNIAIGENITQINIHATNQPVEELFDVVEVEERYRRQVVKYCNSLALLGIRDSAAHLDELTLDQVFVKLNIQIESRSHPSTNEQQRNRNNEPQVVTTGITPVNRERA